MSNLINPYRMTNQSPNRAIGPFLLLQQLNDDASVSIWLARDTKLDQDVGLILISPHRGDDATTVPDLLRQAEQLTRLRHAHLLPPYSVTYLDGQIAIATEQLLPPTLATTLQARDRLPWDEMLALLEPICAVLDYLHSQDVIHTRIHPNIIQLNGGRGVLVGGLLPAALAIHRADFSTRSPETLAYQAPEVGQTAVIGPQTDVYALGCLVYVMLRGQPLFAGKTPAAVQQARLRGPRFPTAWPEKLADEVEAILRRAVAPDPSARYASAGAFYQALHDFTEATVQAQQQVVQPSVLWRRVLPLVTWLLITLVVLGAIIVAVAWGGR